MTAKEKELTWQEKIIIEKMDLDQRLASLAELVHSTKFRALPSDEKLLITEQKSVMTRYSAVLDKRISRFH